MEKEKTLAEWKDIIKTYTTKQIQNTFDNPQDNLMSDEFKLALWEILQERNNIENELNNKSSIDQWKEVVKKYDHETVETAFRSNKYNRLIDDQKAALVEVLEEQKNNQVTTTNSKKSHLTKTEFIRLTSLIGFLLLAFLLLNYRLLTIIYKPSLNQDNITKPIIK